MTSHTGKYLLQGTVALLLLLVLIATFLVYKPGMSGTFVFDDNPNIVNNADIAIQNIQPDTLRRAAFSSNSGPLLRPVSMLSFAANYLTTEFDPYYFKMTNLVIHLVNGTGIFFLSALLLRIYRKRFEPGLSTLHVLSVSLAVATAWLLHPFNLTSVLYIVQRMTSLSALFCIWGLVLFVWGRTRLTEGKNGILPILIGLFVFMPLAALSKETGALMPAFMLIIEITLFNLQTAKPSARRFLIGFFAVTVALPALAVLTFIATHPAWLSAGYQGRNFTLPERVMTEARVLWFYLHQIVLPNIAEMGLFHDDIVNSQGLLTPVTTLLSIMGIALLLAVSWIARKKAPLITFGILFFLVGHVLESSVFPLEITHEHRNYLPMFGILFVIFFYLLYPLKVKATLRLRQIIALLLIALFAYDTRSRASDWSNPFDLAKSEVEHHPDSARDNGEMGNNFAAITVQDANLSEVYYQQAVHYYEQSAIVDPHYTNGLFALLMLSSDRNKNIDVRWMNDLEHRLRYSPVDNDTGNKLIRLVTCTMEQKCKLDNKDLEKLINAALQNPTVIGPKRAMILSSRSYYLVDLAKNYPAALDVMLETVKIAPQELQYRLTLVKYLGALRRTEEAKKQLAILKRMDNLHAYTAQIAAQEKLLAEQENITRH
ncbi:MAG: hypothetical protein ACHP7O_01340 [Burkholderiales bacterium]